MIELAARIEAKRLRFDELPETKVHVDGDRESRSERVNLPERVEPGATYRNVEARWAVRLS